MSKVFVEKQYTKYINGLHTESHALDFPDGFSYAENNFELRKDRSRIRRRGIDYEVSHALLSEIATGTPYTLDHTTAAYGAYAWDAPGGFDSASGALVQIGNYLYLHGLRNPNKSISASRTGNLRIADPTQVNPVITAISNANPAVITTATPHGVVTGDLVSFNDKSYSMQQINAGSYVATWISNTTFSIALDTTLFPAYSTAGGSAEFILHNKDYIDLSWFKSATATTAATVAQDHVDITFGMSRAFVVGANINPFYIEWHNDEFRASIHQIDIKVRDVDGVEDNLPIDTRPNVSSSHHQYNLLNQGWDTTTINTFLTATPAATGAIASIPAQTPAVIVDIGMSATAAGFVVGDSLTIRDMIAGGSHTPFSNWLDGTYAVTAVAGNTVTIALDLGPLWIIQSFGFWGRVPAGGSGVYPSNADIWTYGKNATFNGINNLADHQFDGFIMAQQDFGTTLAPRGHFVYNAFSFFRSLHASGVEDDITIARPTTVEFYNGRLFYSGVQDNNRSGKIYFSRVVRDVKTHAGQCYQDNDPTSEHFNELLPNDGGVIELPQSGNVKKIISAGNSLIVFATNGIWSITSAGGFSATGYGVQQLSNIGTVYPSSVVKTDFGIVYAARSGIYTITDKGVVDMTQSSISTEYAKVLQGTYPDVKSVFDEVNKKLFVWFNPNPAETIEERFTHVLIYDFILKSWYTYSISALDTQPFVAGVLYSPTHPDKEIPRIKMLTIVPAGAGNTYTAWQYTFSDFIEVNFKDWKTHDSIGVDAAAYMETGYDLLGHISKEKQIDYITTYMNRTEVVDPVTNVVLSGLGGCMLRLRWNFSNSSQSGKWSRQQEIYKLKDYEDVVTSKNRFSGTGKAIQLRFDTEPNKDCHILAWAFNVSGMTKA